MSTLATQKGALPHLVHAVSVSLRMRRPIWEIRAMQALLSCFSFNCWRRGPRARMKRPAFVELRGATFEASCEDETGCSGYLTTQQNEVLSAMGVVEPRWMPLAGATCSVLRVSYGVAVGGGGGDGSLCERWGRTSARLTGPVTQHHGVGRSNLYSMRCASCKQAASPTLAPKVPCAVFHLAVLRADG